jgi:hypothetical protein
MMVNGGTFVGMADADLGDQVVTCPDFDCKAKVPVPAPAEAEEGDTFVEVEADCPTCGGAMDIRVWV